MNGGVADGRKKERKEKNLSARGWVLGFWWIGGHENVNLNVSEAIYSGLGIQSCEGRAARVKSTY